MKKKSMFLLTMVLLALTMTVLPVFAKDSAADRQQAKSIPELALPSTSARSTNSKILKTVSAPVKLDKNKINQPLEIIFEKNGKGVYFLKYTDIDFLKYEIIFYNFKNNTYTSVYTAPTPSYSFYYINNNTIYFLDSNEHIQENGTEKTYICSMSMDKYDFETGSSSHITFENVKFNENYYYNNYVNCFGVDQKGRIYVSTNDNTILLFNNIGKVLSKTSTSDSVLQFCGFDPVNGNFYYISHYNWVYGGYNHNMASMMAGNVNENNVIKVKDTNIMILYQYYVHSHKNPVTMLNDKYLTALSMFGSDTGVLLNSNAYDYTDAIDSSANTTTLINIANTDAITATFPTATSDYDDYGHDTSSIGPRCALNEDETALLIKVNSNVLTEYDMTTKTEKIHLQMKHPVYTFDIKGDQCIAVEKEGDDFYIENINWVYPTDIEVESPDSLTVGSSGKITCTSNNDSFKLNYSYESSDSSVVSVDKKGKLNAFKSGKATITVKASPINVTKQVTITVKGATVSPGNTSYKISNVANSASSITHSTTTISSFFHENAQTAYVTPLKNGNYERLEYQNKKIIREVYDYSFKLLSKSTIPFELSIWGGYFSGQKYNFLLFGQKNPKENDKQEVYRIVKYDKNWKRLGACSVRGANTYIPFDAGGADMTETNGKLYIHTCHEMYRYLFIYRSKFFSIWHYFTPNL